MKNMSEKQSYPPSTFLSARSVKLALLGITFVALFYNNCAHASYVTVCIFDVWIEIDLMILFVNYLCIHLEKN